MPSRAYTFWMAVHRYAGLAAMVLLAVAGLTGTALTLVRVADPALNPELFAQGPAAASAPVLAPAPAVLVARALAAHPEFTLRGFPLAVPADQRIPVKVVPAQWRGAEINQLFLDRATGAIAAARSDRPAWSRAGAMTALHDFHENLLLGTFGRLLLAAVAALWLVGNLVGIYLTLPQRGAFWKQWKRTWKVGRGTPLPRLMLDLHRAPGLWLALPFTLVAATALFMNLFDEVYSPLLDRLSPEPKTELAAPAGWQPRALALPELAARAAAEATARHEPRRPATVVGSADGKRWGVTLTDDGTLNYHALGPVYFWFDRQDGHLAEIVDPYHGNTNLAFVRWLYPVHSGRVIGLLGIVVVALVGLVTVLMGVTGTYVWWKKRPGRLRARKANR